MLKWKKEVVKQEIEEKIVDLRAMYDRYDHTMSYHSYDPAARTLLEGVEDAIRTLTRSLQAAGRLRED